jgi:hypothetical protein
MSTRAILSPLSAEFPASNFPQLVLVNRRPVLAFDATTAEKAFWSLLVPQGWTGTKTLVLTYMMASATTGGVAFDVAVEAVTDGDATDLDAGDSFDTVNTGTATVPGTAGYIDQISITLTNNDGSAAGDYLRVSIERATGNGSDTATGDCYLLAVELRDAA